MKCVYHNFSKIHVHVHALRIAKIQCIYFSIFLQSYFMFMLTLKTRQASGNSNSFSHKRYIMYMPTCTVHHVHVHTMYIHVHVTVDTCTCLIWSLCLVFTVLSSPSSLVSFSCKLLKHSSNDWTPENVMDSRTLANLILIIMLCDCGERIIAACMSSQKVHW